MRDKRVAKLRKLSLFPGHPFGLVRNIVPSLRSSWNCWLSCREISIILSNCRYIRGHGKISSNYLLTWFSLIETSKFKCVTGQPLARFFFYFLSTNSMTLPAQHWKDSNQHCTLSKNWTFAVVKLKTLPSTLENFESVSLASNLCCTLANPVRNCPKIEKSYAACVSKKKKKDCWKSSYYLAVP